MPGHARHGSRSASPFTVANIAAEAEAGDSVEAKKVATQNAEMRAFRLLLSRILDFRAKPRIPELPPADVERLISGIETRGEGVTSTSYSATFGVSFSERSITALLSHNGAVPILDRGPEILIVPVYIQDGTAAASDRNPWRGALLGLDLSHALVPPRSLPSGRISPPRSPIPTPQTPPPVWRRSSPNTTSHRCCSPWQSTAAAIF